ncbi:metalloprotease [Coemansia sp. RSA 2322]|nr:metalloprotease [Coemansia sp. RSA 2322]
MTKRVNEFIRQYRQKLLDMTMREFETAVQSLIRLKQDKLKSVSAEFSRFRGHIVSNKYDFDALNDEVAHLEQLRKGDLLAVWDTYVNADTAPQYTRIDLQMWSAKIWQPSAGEFEAYPSAVLALYGWLRSSGQTALSIADLYEFVKASAASDNNGAENASSIEPVLAKLSELYIDKDSTPEHKDVWSSSSKISTALQMAISGANDHAKFASLCKTNLASIGMRRSPDGVWLINDYKQFKQTQALHGLPIPARQLVPVAADSIPDSGAE